MAKRNRQTGSSGGVSTREVRRRATWTVGIVTGEGSIPAGAESIPAGAEMIFVRGVAERDFALAMCGALLRRFDTIGASHAWCECGAKRVVISREEIAGALS